MTAAAHDPKWCFFFDFHTMPACPDVGAGFDAEVFADHIKACGVDFVVFPAKCNLGMAYYNTKAGTRHPSLDYDLFGRISAACKAKDIALSAYINVGLSHEQALLHREWCTLTPEGFTYKPDRLHNFFRTMCYNTGYGEHILEMVREVVSGYPVAGLFLDCMGLTPCVGVECVREMKQRGLDWNESRRLAEFAQMSRMRMATRIADAARAVNPNLLLYFNGIGYEDQQDIADYIEFECLPTGGWDYETLPVFARYLRTLGKPVVNMTARFHRSWGDFGGIRTEASLEYDCLHGLANAMRTTIGDHFHPRGDVNRAASDLKKRIYSRLQEMEPWIDGARALADAAVVAPPPGFRTGDHEAQLRSLEAVRGATRMLCELKVQFDILSDRARWDGYRVLVLPDRIALDETAAAKIEAHLESGGAVLSTGWSGLDSAKSDFAMKEWGLRFQGDEPLDPAYLQAAPPFSQGIPDMPLTLYERGAAIEPLEGARVLAHIVAPYTNRHWDGEHGVVYSPPDRPTGRAAVTVKGKVAHASHPLFTIYARHAPVPMRQIVANLLQELLPQPLVKTPGAPSFARVTVTAQPQRRMVHVLAYVPERRGDVDMIEEPIELRDVCLHLRLDNRPPQRVYVAPAQDRLSFDVAEGYVRVRVPVVRGHAMVVFEDDHTRVS